MNPHDMYNLLSKEDLIKLVIDKDEEITRWFEHKTIDNRTIQDQSDLIEELKAKLAESENALKCTIDHYEKYCSEINHQNVMLYASAFNLKQHNQDKISFALKQLEKVKEHGKSIEKIIYKHYENTKNTNVVSDCHYGKLITISNIVKFIDNQIEELKKEMK